MTTTGIASDFFPGGCWSALFIDGQSSLPSQAKQARNTGKRKRGLCEASGGREKLFFTYIHLYLLIFAYIHLYWLELARTIFEPTGGFPLFGEHTRPRVLCSAPSPNTSQFSRGPMYCFRFRPARCLFCRLMLAPLAQQVNEGNEGCCETIFPRNFPNCLSS
jgi:hypothetical protein